MSLVTDALRKARQNGTEGDGEDRLGRFGQSPPKTSRLGLGLILGAGIALTAALAGGVAAVWFLGSEDSPQPAAEIAPTQPHQEQSPKALPSEGLRTQPLVEERDRQSAEPAVESTRSAAPPSSHLDDTPREALVQETAPAETLNPATPPAGESPPPQEQTQPHPPAIAQPPTERNFVLEADLGYAKLSLDFIVFRSTDPFAEINGREVHEGSEVEGFTVEKIESTRVTLRDARGSLILRTR